MPISVIVNRRGLDQRPGAPGLFVQEGVISGLQVANYVENITKLSLIDVSQLSDGTTYYVQSVRDNFVFSSASFGTPDNITVVAGAGGGRWGRRLSYDPAWGQVTQWFVDSSTGNDENFGTSSLTPLRSYSEVTRRIGQTNISESSTVATVLPTTTLAANIATAITGGIKFIKLLSGSYVLEGPIDLPSNFTLKGEGKNETLITWGLASGSNVEPTNAMLRARGVLNTTKLNTVPTTNASGVGSPFYPPGTEVITVAASGTLTDGNWIFYSGHNDPVYGEYTSSPGGTLVWGDLLQVKTVTSGGLKLNLAHDVLSYHTITNGGVGTPITIKGADPVLNVTISDLTLDGRDIAVGFLCDYGSDIEINNCGFRRFALDAVYTRYCRTVLLDRNYMGGALNGLIRADTTHQLTIRNTRSNDRGDRYCSVGRSFGAISLINNCSQVRIYDNEFIHIGLGFNGTGFRACALDNNMFRDLDSEEYKTRDTAAADDFTLGVLGLGVHLGCVSLNIAEFNQGWIDNNTTIDDARHAQMTGAEQNADNCSYWWHDTTDGLITSLAIRNKGKSPYQNIDGVVRYMTGLRGHDANGQFVNVHVRGCEYALRPNAGGWKMNNVEIVLHASQGTIPVIGAFFESGFGVVGIIELQNITVPSIYYAPSFGTFGDYGLATFRNLRLSDYWFEGPLFFAQNTTGIVIPGGSVVALRNDGTVASIRQLVFGNDTNAGALVRVAAGPGGFGAPVNGHALFELLPSPRGYFVAKTADEVKMGQSLRWEGGQSLVVTPNGAGPIVGTALTVKAAGVAGTVLAGG